MNRPVCMCAWLIVAVCGLLPSAAYGRSGSDDYADRLRREIAERARELRNVRNGESSSGWTSLNRNRNNNRNNNNQRNNNNNDGFGIDLANPFGPGLDFATQAWDDASRGRYDLNIGNGKRSTDTLDLNGQPLSSLQPRRIQPTQATEQPKKLTEEEKKQQAEEAAAVLKEETDRTIKAAQALIDNGEFGSARRMLVPVTASRRRTPEDIAAAQALITQIDTEGMKRLAEADAAANAGDPDKAATAYAELARQFVTAPAASLARTRLAVLRAKPEVAAKFLYDKAAGYLKRNRPDVAGPMLRDVVARYAKTEYAAKAAVLLEKLEKEGAATEGLSPDDVLRARKGLMIGDIHALNGRTEQAVRSYQSVIQDFEDTKYAQTARARIAELTQ